MSSMVEHSLYEGRARLGGYARTGKRSFKTFDAENRPLGIFRSPALALAAIRAVPIGDQAEAV
jgi:hypothetical protein